MFGVYDSESCRALEPENSSQTISAFRNEGPAKAGEKEGSLTSAYRVENTTLVSRNGDDMLRFRYGAESEVWKRRATFVS